MEFFINIQISTQKSYRKICPYNSLTFLETKETKKANSNLKIKYMLWSDFIFQHHYLTCGGSTCKYQTFDINRVTQSSFSCDSQSPPANFPTCQWSVCVSCPHIPTVKPSITHHQCERFTCWCSGGERGSEVFLDFEVWQMETCRPTTSSPSCRLGLCSWASLFSPAWRYCAELLRGNGCLAGQRVRRWGVGVFDTHFLAPTPTLCWVRVA